MIAKQVSSPIRSASASGPSGCAKPSFAIVSIASASATPSCSAQTASLMNGIRMRFETNPGKSFATAGVLPSSRASSVIASAVSSDVSRARMISTSFSTGTGLKKCIPITLSGRFVAAASDPIGIEEVFDASTASGGNASSACRKISSFTSASSTTASSIRSARTRPSTGVILASASSGPAPPFSASFSRLFRIAASPRSTAPGAESWIDTRRPEAATTWAMPPPICPAPTTRTCSKRTRGAGLDLDEKSVALAAARADRREAQASPVSTQLVDHRAEDARSGGPVWMAERHRAAVHVHLLRIDVQHPRRVEHDGGEGLVQLDALDVVDRLAGLLERLLARLRRRPGEVGELVGDVRLRNDRRQRLEPALACECLAGRDDLVAEAPLVDRPDRALVRTERPLVLVLSRDPELARDERRLLDHVTLVEGRREPVVRHQVDQRPVAEPIAEAGLLEDVGRVRHRLHSACDDHVVVAGPDHLVGDLDRANRGGADLVDRVGAELDRQSSPDRRLPRRRLAGAALEHLAHDGVLDVLVGDPGAVERRPDHERAELGRLVARKRAAELPERGANCAEDDTAGHESRVADASRLTGSEPPLTLRRP